MNIWVCTVQSFQLLCTLEIFRNKMWGEIFLIEKELWATIVTSVASCNRLWKWGRGKWANNIKGIKQSLGEKKKQSLEYLIHIRYYYYYHLEQRKWTQIGRDRRLNEFHRGLSANFHYSVKCRDQGSMRLLCELIPVISISAPDVARF